MLVAVDFDGTLTEQSECPLQPPYPPTPALRLDVVEMLKEYRGRGHQLILWTCREGEGLTEAINLCLSHDLYFDYINYSPLGGSPKVIADVYFDDRAVNSIEELQRRLEGSIIN